MITYRVQHAPGRDEPLERLLAGLPAETEVVTDMGGDPPNPWRGYQLCLAPSAGTHVCVIQDDAIVCPNFSETLERVVQRWPDNVIVLFLPGAALNTRPKFLQALAHGRNYCDLSLREFMPVVAVCWPVGKAAEFLEWAQTAVLPGMPRHDVRSDDAVAGLWQRTFRERIIVTVPSLVEHPDDVESTVGLRARAGADVGRVALKWVGDPSLIDW